MAYERKTSDIFISDDLKNILKEIESESLVAQLLLKKRHKKDVLVDDIVNYISVSSQDKGRLSYLTSDRISSITDDEYWKTSKRYVAKPGTLVGKLFKDISAKEIEKFSLLFRSESQKPSFRFEVVSGEAIKKIYHYGSVSCDGSGSLGISCMKHEHCQKFLDIYSENEDKISMLVMFNDDDYVIGRALLWDFDSHKLMDRIYTVQDELYAMYFKKWCIKNGYLHKSEQNWYNTLYFEQFGQKRIELRLKLSLKNNNFEYYPYMDTFKIIDNEGNLYNYHPDDVEFKTICSTDGRKQGSDFIRFDSINNVFRYPGDTVYLGYRSIYTHHDNCYYSESMDLYILRDDSYYSDEAKDYIFNESYESLNDKDKINNRISYYKEREDARKKMGEKKMESSNNSPFGSFMDTLDSFTEYSNLYGRFRRARVNTNIDDSLVEPTTEPEFNGWGIETGEFDNVVVEATEPIDSLDEVRIEEGSDQPQPMINNDRRGFWIDYSYDRLVVRDQTPPDPSQPEEDVGESQIELI